MVGRLTSYYETYEFNLIPLSIKLDKLHYLFCFLCKHKVEGSNKTAIGQIFNKERERKADILKDWILIGMKVMSQE